MDFLFNNPVYFAIYAGSRLFVFVCIMYYFIRKGNFKTNLLKWIVAANTLLLIVAVPTSIQYIIHFFNSWYSGVEYEQYAFRNRVLGPYWWAYWLMIFNTVVLPNLLWFKRVRHSAWAMILFFVPVLMEQFVIIITSFHRDYLPSSWTLIHPYFIDWVSFSIYAVSLTVAYYTIDWFNKRKGAKTILEAST